MLHSNTGTARVVVPGRRLDRQRRRSDQFAGAHDASLAAGAGEQAVVADPVEPLGQYVQQEAPE